MFYEEHAVEVEAEESISVRMHYLECSFDATAQFSDRICHIWTLILGCTYEPRAQTAVLVGRPVNNPVKEVVAM
jgi:hypothetical protein